MCSQRWEWCIALELLLLPHLFLATSQVASFYCSFSAYRVIAISGSNVTLKISNFPDKWKQFTWFYNTNRKIVERESNETIFFNSKFKGRASLDESQALWIYNVQKEDRSTYIVKVLEESGNEKSYYILLEVFDPVPKPVIKIEETQEVKNSCHLKLSCEITNWSVNYTWYGDSVPFPTEVHSNVLEITINQQKYYKNYTCEVSNAVSSKNDTVYFTLPCTLARSSGVAWTATWLVVMVPIVLTLLWTRDDLL